jgi:hypothetical protein
VVVGTEGASGATTGDAVDHWRSGRMFVKRCCVTHSISAAEVIDAAKPCCGIHSGSEALFGMLAMGSRIGTNFARFLNCALLDHVDHGH